MKVKAFKNEPIKDFSLKKNYEFQKEALRLVQKKLGKTYPLIIGGKSVKSNNTFNSINPSNKSEVVATFYKATKEQAIKAIETAHKTFKSWALTKPEERAEILFKAAQIIRDRRFEINAWMIKEVGKNFTEADADTAEAIDFLEFYGREMLRYAQKQPITPIKGENNELFYIPLGVVGVIPPWNFPFAILAGMTSAAIVTGNTVVLKPASDSPMMGKLFYDVMAEAGLPEGVLNFIPGSGEEVGDTIVEHPLTRMIAFTGSLQVGISIYEKASKLNEGQIWLKRVIAELGGKDAIIVDDEADIDSAVKGVITSAYGFQGQKCSACSRAIVVNKVYDKFKKKLLEEMQKIQVGPAEENYIMGPVVSEKAMKTILNYIEIGKQENKLIFGGEVINKNGFYLQPTIFENVKPNDTIAQEEIFGPVLALIKAKDFKEAIEIANNTKYGLTGAVYSNNQEKLDFARIHFHCGNLYFNRKCTGALVGGHPFGGFNLSGTDSKAGGRDYLLLFLQAKVVSQKI
ncbi:MAG TPA: L-glutamate gamma-semialdehyde dehydrogenase [Ignavibacteriales bacterium]|nr:L-glutamate gamma-semialdehyde dehydrogenase [Ignavibacteriales bacterium]